MKIQVQVKLKSKQESIEVFEDHLVVRVKAPPVDGKANIRIIETMAKEMKIPDSVLIADDIRTNGNTSAASIPLAMDRILEEHPELHGKLARHVA